MQTTTETQDGLYVGADLHGNNVFLTVCDQQGKRVMQRRVKANLAAVNQALDPYWSRTRSVAVESTFNWYWFVDGLRKEGRDVRLANPAKMEQYGGLKATDDATDAGWIAEQLRLGILPECYVYPPEVRPIRDVLRRRMLIVQQRTQSLLSLESLFARYGWSWPGVYKIKGWKLEDIQGIQTDPMTELQLTCLLELVRKQDGVAKWIEGKVMESLKPTGDYERAKQVAGIGPILGMVVVLESGDFQRFPSAGDYASYCRTVKSERTSNEKKKGQNNRKNGNPYLSWAFAEAAVYAIRHYPRIQGWYERKKRRSNSPKALRALACKLAKATWHVMRGKDFEEGMLFGFAGESGEPGSGSGKTRGLIGSRAHPAQDLPDKAGLELQPALATKGLESETEKGEQGPGLRQPK
jgi:transposase